MNNFKDFIEKTELKLSTECIEKLTEYDFSFTREWDESYPREYFAFLDGYFTLRLNDHILEAEYNYEQTYQNREEPFVEQSLMLNSEPLDWGGGFYEDEELSDEYVKEFLIKLSEKYADEWQLLMEL